MHDRSMSYAALLGAALLVAVAAPSRASDVFDASFTNSSPIPMRVSAGGGCNATVMGSSPGNSYHTEECTRITSATITPSPRPADGEIRIRLARLGFELPPSNPGAFTSQSLTVTLHPQCKPGNMAFFIGTQHREHDLLENFERRVTDAQGKLLGWEITIRQVCSHL